MHTKILLVGLATIATALGGCFGGDDFVPGEGFDETGRTVELRMWVEDLVKADVYPGLKLNFWAFCAEPFDPNDEYSANAIEYLEPSGVVQRLQSDGTYRLDEETTAKCSVPAPQIRVQQGDRVIVHFENNHFHPHTIHWHGQYVTWTSDGVPGSTQDAVVPPPSTANTFEYDFIAKRAGTLWYHCHVDTQFHVMQGLYGMIIVEPQDKSGEPDDIDREYSLVLSNGIREQMEFIPPRPGEVFDPHAKHKHGGACGASGFPGCQNPAVEAKPDVFLMNGVSFPNTLQRDDTLIHLNPGEKIRIRILNAGPFTIETLHLHGHDMLVTHRDGNPVPAPFYVDTLTVGPGERYDVVVEGREDAVGIWVFHTHITSHVTNDFQYPGGMLTKLVYDDALTDGLTPYDGVELPGGRPPRWPVTIPQDYLDTELLQLPVLNALPVPGVGGTTVETTFPVVEPCAVEKVVVQGSAFASNPAFELLSTVDVEILAPDGASVFSDEIGGLLVGQDTFRFEMNETSTGLTAASAQAGDYTVRIGGANLDATASVRVLVDYYPDLATADAAAKTYVRPYCGEIPQSVLDENGY